MMQPPPYCTPPATLYTIPQERGWKDGRVYNSFTLFLYMYIPSLSLLLIAIYIAPL